MSETPISTKTVKVATVSYGLRQVLVMLMALGVNVVLTRFLAPQDFGLVAIATLILGLGTLVADGGLGLHLIQRSQAVTEQDLSEVLSLQLLLSGGVITVLALLTLGLNALGWGHAALGLSLAASVTLPFSAVRGVTLLPFERSVLLGRIALVDIVEQAVFAVAAVALALWGAGAWGMIGGMIVKSLFGCLLAVWLAPWRFRFRLPDWNEQVRTGLRFALNYQGAQFVNLVRIAVNPLYLGALLGLPSVGYMERATYVNSAPVSLLSSILHKVFFPVSARIQEDRGRLKRFLADTVFLYSALDKLVYLPLLIFAEPFTALVLTEKWLPMVPLLQWLFVGTMLFNSVTSPLYPVFNALGASNVLFRYGVVGCLASWALMVPLCWRFGIDGVGMASVVLWLGVFWLKGQLQARIGEIALFRHALPSWGAALAAGLGVVALQHLTGQRPGSLLALGLWAALAMGLYLIVLLLVSGRRLGSLARRIVHA